MSATESPRFASCSATEVPTMPAPRTIASVRCAMPVLVGNVSCGTYISHPHSTAPSMADMPRNRFDLQDFREFLMPLTALAAPLSWLGRQGTRAVATSIFIGILTPPLAALFKPVFPFALFA